MKVLQSIKIIGISLLFAVGISACNKPGPVETAGKKVDQAVEKADKKIDEAVDKVDDKLKK